MVDRGHELVVREGLGPSVRTVEVPGAGDDGTGLPSSPNSSAQSSLQ